MAVAAFKSTTRRQWDIRGVEIDGSPVPATPSRSMNRSPTRRSRDQSPTESRLERRRSMSKAPSPTRGRRGVSREPTARRSLSKAPSPTRGRRGVSREPVSRVSREVTREPAARASRDLSREPVSRASREVTREPAARASRDLSREPIGRARRDLSREPTGRARRDLSREPIGRVRGASREPVARGESALDRRRSMSKAPSPTRRTMSRVASPTKDRRRSESVTRGPSPTRGRRALSPTRGRSFRAASRGPSPTRSRRGVSRGPESRVAATPARATSPNRRLSTSTRVASPEKAPSRPISGRVLRRTQSSAEMALSQFLADASVASDSSPTAAATATRHSGIGVRGSPARSSRTLPSDSESEVEPRYTRRLDRSFSARRDSSDNESVQSSRSSVSKRTSGLRYGSLRRSSTTQHELRRSLEIADTSTPEYYQKPKPLVEDHHHHHHNEAAGEEKTIEEKTIQEVHSHPVVQTLCYNCLYDVSASADVPQDGAVSPVGAVKMKGLGNSREAPHTGGEVDFVALYNTRCAEVRRAVSDARSELENVKEPDLRKVIEAKLELSEKKVSDLLHLVKSVSDPDELEVEDVTPSEEPDLKKHNHRYPPEDDMDESDFIRQSLDDEAARYFEECAIIANFDANVADDISVVSSVDSGETTVNAVSTSRRQSSSDSQEFTSLRTTSKRQITPLDDEGMLLPWLDWEPEVDLGRKERLEKAVADFRKWKSSWARKSVEWGKSSTRERGRDEGAANVDEFLFERTRLQGRIAQGRMLVCGGKR